MRPAVLRGGQARGRLPGLLLFAIGVTLYRVAGKTLGDALSPLVEPRPGAERELLPCHLMASRCPIGGGAEEEAEGHEPLPGAGRELELHLE